MATRNKSDGLDQAIATLVRERFPQEAIERVIVTREVDASGEPIVDVMVIFRVRPKVSQIKGLARNIWNSLSDEDGIPVLSFRSAAEQSKMTREAA